MGDSLIIRIGANANEYAKELGRLKQSTASLEKGLAKTAKISAAGFAILTAAVGAAVVQFSKFEKSFTNVQTLLDKSSFKTKSLSKGVKDLKTGILSLGASSGESFEILNKGLFDIVSAGIDAEQSINVLTTATELATAGATDTSVAVDGLTSAMNAYGLSADEAGDVAAKFFLAQKGGKTTVAELASGFGLAGSSAKEFGVSLDELLASVSAVTLGGVKTRAAYTGLNATLAGIAQPTEAAAKEAQRLGVTFDSTALRTLGLKGFLDQLTGSANFNKTSIEKLFGSVEAKKFVFALAGSQAKSFAEQLENLGDKSKLAVTFQEALAIKMATTDKAVLRLKTAFQAIVIQLGEKFAPLIIKVADLLTGMAKAFNNLSEGQKTAIAKLVAFGIAVTGAVATVATFTLGLLKIRRLLLAARVAFGAARVAAVGFTAAATGGLSLILTFLPEIILGLKTIIGLANKGSENKTIEDIDRNLRKLNKSLIVNKKLHDTAFLATGIESPQITKIKDEIKALEELRKKRVEAGAKTEDGSLLLRPKTDGSDPFAGLDTQLTGSATVTPLAPAPAEGGNEKLKEKEAEKTAIINEATQERIRKAQEANELLEAEALGVSEVELDILKQKQELEQAEKAANEITNNQLRAVELENVQLQKDKLLETEKEHQIARAEEIALAREQEKALNLELQELDAEEKAALNEKDLEQLRTQVKTKTQIRQDLAKEKLSSEIKQRNDYLRDEEKHGTAVATFKKGLNSEELNGFRQTSGQLAQLANSKNSKMKAIGKAAALANIAIDTARGAVSAYTSLAPIPIVGPGLGIAAAAALVAYGAERITQVNSAQRGGIVPNSVGGGSRDRVPMLLEPDELVVPKGLAPDFIQSVGRPDTQAEGKDGEGVGTAVVEISIEDEAADLITAKQRENTDLAIGVA